MLTATLGWRTALAGSFTSYANSGGIKAGAKFRLIDLSFIFLYSVACAIIPLPLLAEAPMFLFPRLSRASVLITCAIGKGSGALVVLLLGGLVAPVYLGSKIVSLPLLEGIGSSIFTAVSSFMRTYGFWAFLLSMSVPFFPMRTAIYSASLLGVNPLKFALAVAFGTIIRTSLVFWGYKSIRRFRRLHPV